VHLENWGGQGSPRLESIVRHRVHISNGHKWNQKKKKNLRQGLGCRSLGYLLYGGMSTIIWGMLVLSSILSHYTCSYPDRPRNTFSAVRLAKVLANVLRWGGKSLAIVNALWIIATGMLQFTSVYDNCYCNSSVFWLGVDGAYDVIFPSASQVHITTVAWFGALALGCCISVKFIFFYEFIN
jgi:hypothetical protein